MSSLEWHGQTAVCVDVRVLDRREARRSELDVLVEVGVLDHSKVDSASVRRDR